LRGRRGIYGRKERKGKMKRERRIYGESKQL
jgi:hypothetical protein